ncbi:MAG: tripartite tricarboxylate transporter TctB family protein [Sneathiellaceae bacterium]
MSDSGAVPPAAEPPPMPALAAGSGAGAAHDLVAALLGLAALALLAASPWLVDQSGPDPFYKGPLIFPLIALALAAAGAAPAGWRLLRRATAPGDWQVDGRGFPRAAAGLFAVMCAFPVLILALGLQVAVFLALLGGLWAAGWRRPLAAPAVALVLALLVHLAFRTFLDIWFPTPLLGDWLRL